MRDTAHDRPRRTISPTAFARLATASFIGLLVIVPSGGLVRLTDSGLGCPDWPGCHGEVVPPMSGHAWIEYSNRVLSAVVVALALVTWVVSYRVARRPASLSRIAMIPAIAGLLQGPLGGLTVLFDLHPLLVSSHFLLSIVALGGGVVLVVAARDHAVGRTRRTDRRGALVAGAALLALTGVIVTGVLVTAAGPHSGDPAVIRRMGDLGAAAAVHVRFVIAFVIVGLALAGWLLRTGGVDRQTRTLAIVFAPLLALQIGIGEYQYRNRLPWEVILGHVTVAGALWSIGVAIAWCVGRPATAPEPTQAEPEPPANVPELAASHHAAST